MNVLLEEFWSVAFFPTSPTSLDLKYTQSILLRAYTEDPKSFYCIIILQIQKNILCNDLKKKHKYFLSIKI